MANKILLSKIKKAEYNPRTMPDHEMTALKKSILNFGFVEPVVVNRRKNGDQILVGGHQRIVVLEQLISDKKIPNGIEKTEDDWSIPTTFVELDSHKERALNLALNKISGRWDDKKLTNIILGIKLLDSISIF